MSEERCKEWVFFDPEKPLREEEFNCEEPEFRIFAEKGSDFFFARVEAPLLTQADGFVEKLIRELSGKEWTVDTAVNTIFEIINSVEKLYGKKVFEKGYYLRVREAVVAAFEAFVMFEG